MSPEHKPWFVAFEGVEGSGKSTHVRKAAKAVEAMGRMVRLTAEPGGTPLGSHLREILLNRKDFTPTPLAELFLYLADRVQHVEQVIGPALRNGETVLTDRFSASTIAYQGYGRGLGLTEVAGLESWSRKGLFPHLIILLDCPVSVGLERARGNDRFHEEQLGFHERVRQGFLAMADADPAHWVRIDSTRPEEEVHNEVMQVLEARLGIR